MKDLITQADLQKGANASERMNGQPQLLSSKKITHYFEIWTDESCVLKENVLPLQKFDALNRSY